MGSTRYVEKGDDGGWDVVKEGHRRATAHSATKKGAVEAARELVRNDGGGEVRIMNRTGKVVEAATVPRRRRRAA
jgi:uncharacterized protein DUF2188